MGQLSHWSMDDNIEELGEHTTEYVGFDITNAAEREQALCRLLGE